MNMTSEAGIFIYLIMLPTTTKLTTQSTCVFGRTVLIKGLNIAVLGDIVFAAP